MARGRHPEPVELIYTIEWYDSSTGGWVIERYFTDRDEAEKYYFRRTRIVDKRVEMRAYRQLRILLTPRRRTIG